MHLIYLNMERVLMSNKDLYFISSIVFMIVFAAIFYLFGKCVIKNNKKLQLLAISAIAICLFITISVIWVKGYNFGGVQKGIITGASGCLIGLIASTNSDKKPNKNANKEPDAGTIRIAKSNVKRKF